MKLFTGSATVALSLLSVRFSAAAPPAGKISESARDLAADGYLNGPDTRSQWLPGFDITNDTDTAWPNTGQVREFTFTITNTTCNPDGHGEIECLLLNNQLPGPPITADWGDTIRVNIINKMQNNGTSIHYHGVRQYETNSQDGVNGVTECPLAPGLTRTYEWRATQYGTSWYHSHHTLQLGSGVFGAIVINGPSSANYDSDLGPVVMDDWLYQPGFTALTYGEEMETKGKPGSNPDNFLFNGKAKDAEGNGEYAVFSVQPKKRHKLRLINASTQTTMKFAIQDHSFQVVASDFVPTDPISVDSIMVGIGQRYDIIVEANQTSGAYWIRTEAETVCGSQTKRGGYAVLKYTDQDATVPAGGERDAPSVPPTNCVGPQGMRPFWPSSVGTSQQYGSRAQSIFYGLDLPAPNGSVIVWKFNYTGIDIEWGKPTLTYVAEHNSTYAPSAAVITLPESESWAYWVIQTVGSPQSFIGHPIHLHGHDFYTLGKGLGQFDPATSQLNTVDPVRRDSDYTLGDNHTEKGTWMAIAFKTGNPGAWLLHCHISTHIGTGLGVQYIDTKSKIKLPDQTYYEQCEAWHEYYKHAAYPKTDSGV